MAHRSRKKHIKHMHQHEQANVKAKPAAAKARTEPARSAASDQRDEAADGGLVRRLARKATKKITAKPRKMIDKAKRRVASLLGTEG